MSKNTGTSELINYFDLGVNGDVGIAGSLDVNTIANATTDTDRFLVSDTGIIKYRTGAELLTDIGAAPAVAGGYVPYTGATTNVDLGVYNLTASAIIANGSGSNSGIVHLESNAIHSLVNGYGSIASGTTNQFNLYQTTGAGVFRGAILSLNSITEFATRTFTLPNTDGTIALTSQIPANAVGGTGTTNYLPKFTGSTTIGNSSITDNGTEIVLNGLSRFTAGGFDTYISQSFGNTINFGYNANSYPYDGWVNYRGFQNGTTQFRNFRVGDGKENAIASFIGSTGNVLINTTTDAGFKLDVNGTGRFSGNVGIDISSFASWSGGTQGVLQVKSSSIYEYGGYETALSVNAYFNAGWKYIGNNTATQLQLSSGSLNFKTANSGTANNTITWTTPLTIASTGAATFSSSVTTGATINSGDSITMAGELYYGNVTSNRKLRAYSTGIEGSATLNYSFWNGSTWVIKSTLDYNGAATFSSSVAATGAVTSGTNIGATGAGGTLYTLNGGDIQVYSSGNANYFSLSSPTSGNFLVKVNQGLGAINALNISNTGAATFSSSVTARNGSSGTAFITTNAVDADFIIETVAGGTTKIGTTGNKLAINSAGGNVLIGTTTDTGYKLYVLGAAGMGVSSSVTANNYIANTQGLNVAGYGFLTQTISGQMTILGHNLAASTSVANQVNVVNGGWYSSMIKMYYSAGITFHTSSTVYSAGDVYPMDATERIKIKTNGEVIFHNSIILRNGQINSLTSSDSGQSMYLNFQGNGAIYAGSSYTVLYAGSDERIKTEINHSQSTLTKILNLTPRTFKYKERPEITNYGFIAQEVEKIMPELVRTSEGITMCLDEQIENQKSVESYGLAWASILVKAIQEQQQQIQELKNKLS